MHTDSQLTIEAAIESVAMTAGEVFVSLARGFVLEYLRTHGETSGEALTDACKQAGIVPPDDRAFGMVYRGLSRQGKIRKCGTVVRARGHGTAGGNLWELI